jgi:hypothetical protein
MITCVKCGKREEARVLGRINPLCQKHHDELSNIFDAERYLFINNKENELEYLLEKSLELVKARKRDGKKAI